MNQKISPQVAVGVVVLVLVVVLAFGWFWYRNASGETAAAEMHAAMSKTKPGEAPFTKEQMDQMRRQGR